MVMDGYIASVFASSIELRDRKRFYNTGGREGGREGGGNLNKYNKNRLLSDYDMSLTRIRDYPTW